MDETLTEKAVPKKHSLKSNVIFNFISKILVLIIPLITTPYLARVLHEEGNGQISFATSIITYFILFANLGFETYGQREIARRQDNKYQKSLAFWELIVIKTLLMIVSESVLLLFVFTIGFGEYTSLILILSIQVVATALDIQFLFQGEEDFKSIAIRTIILKIAGLVCIFVFVKDEADTWIYALCLSLSVIVSNIVMWPAIIKRICRVKVRDMHIWHHFLPTLMIFLPTLAVTIYSVFDKTMIGLLSPNPDYDNGCYEQAYKLNSVALLLVTIVPYVLVPRNAYDYASGNREGMQYHIDFALHYVLMIGLPLIAGFAVLSDNLCSWFLGEGYAEVPLLLCIMSVRFIFSGLGVIFGDSIFIVIGKEKYVTLSAVVAAVLNVGLNALFIPYFGAVGAAIATAIAEASICIVLGIFAIIKKFISLKSIGLMSVKYLISAIVMSGVIYIIQKYMPYAIWSFIVITFVGILIYGLILLILKDKFVIGLLSKIFVSLKNKLHKKSN